MRNETLPHQLLKYRGRILLAFTLLLINVSGLLAQTLSVSESIIHTDYGQNNGSISLSIVSGTSPYTYQWSTSSTTLSINNLSPGTYTVTITDANDTIVKHYDLSTYAAWDSLIRMQVTSANVVTVDGSPQDTSNAGMPYGSAISANELLPDSSGKVTYEFAPDSSFSGIIGMSSYPDFNSVPENSFLVINPGGDGNIYLLIDYETFTLSYLGSWDKSSTLRLTLDYTGDSITIYKNGELIFSYAKTREETMYPIILPLAEGSKVDAVACNFGSFPPLEITDEVHHCDFEQDNGSITLTATSGEGITYHWSNTATTNEITNLSTGTYSVTVNSHNGTYIHSYDISTYAIWDTLIRMEETAEHIVTVDGSPIDTTNAGMPLGVAIGANELLPDSSGSVTFEFAPDSSYSGIIGLSGYPDFASVPDNSFLIINPGDDGNIYFLIDYETFTLSYLGAWDKSSILNLRLDYTSDSVMVYKNGDLIYSYAKTRTETMYPAILPLAEGSKVDAVATSIPPSISPPIAPPSQSVCSDTAYTFTFDSIYTHWDSIEWATNSAFTSSTVIPKYGSISTAVDTAATDTIWLRSINTSGKHSGKVFCMAKNLSRPVVIINPKDTVVIEGSPVVLKGGGGNTFDWQGLNSTIDTIAITSDGDSTYYSLSITDSLGCTNTDSAVIRAIPIDVLTYINHKDTLNYDDTTDIEIISNLSGMYINWYRADSSSVFSDSIGIGGHIKKEMVNQAYYPQMSIIKAEGSLLGYKTRPIFIPVYSNSRSIPDIQVETIVNPTDPANVCELAYEFTIRVTVNTPGAYNIQLQFPTSDNYNLQISGDPGFSLATCSSSSNYCRNIAVSSSLSANTYDIVCSIDIPCSLIPNTQVFDNNNNAISPNLTVDIDVAGAVNYQVGNANNASNPFNIQIAYPFIRNVSSPSPATSNLITTTAIANGLNNTFSTTYQNTGNAPFSGIIIYDHENPACATNIHLNNAVANIIPAGGGASVQVASGSTPLSIDLSSHPMGINDRIEIVQDYTVDYGSCLTPCTIQLLVSWGCSISDACIEYATGNLAPPIPLGNSRIKIQKDGTTYTHLYVSRISPAPFTTTPSGQNPSHFVWDASCTNTTTSWEFLIESKGALPSNNIEIDLLDAFFNDPNQSPFNYTYVQNCNFTTTDSRFPSSPALTIPSGDVTTTFLNSGDFASGRIPNCFTDRSGSSNTNEHPVKNYHIHIDHLDVGQTVVVSFETYRCCPDDTYIFNNGINFNHWQLKVTGESECGAIQADINSNGNNLPPTDIQHPYGTSSTTYIPFDRNNFAAGYISPNAYDDVTHPDLYLGQSFMPFNGNLLGGVTDETTTIACGDGALFRIQNDAFPSNSSSVSDYDFDLFANSTAFFGNNTTLAISGNTGVALHGQFKVEFDFPAGLQIDATYTPNITLSDGTSWSAGSNYFPTATIPYAIFDIPSQFASTITATQFRSLFANSIINFNVLGCCGDGIDPNPILTVKTYFNPQNTSSSQTCNECWIPLSSVARQTHIHCPGCVTPGIIVDDYVLERNTFGYQDNNNNGQPETSNPTGIPTLIPITASSSQLDVNKSIPGDELLGTMSAHIQEGSSHASGGTGFTYSEWKTYWGSTALLPELYLEQVIACTDNAGTLLPNNTASNLGMVCTQATFEYFDKTNSTTTATRTYTIPSITTSTPLSISTDDKFLFHVSAANFDPTSPPEFTPEDRFVLTMKYHICGNPQITTNIEVNNTLFLSTKSLGSSDPITSYPQTPQVLTTGEGPEAADPNDDLLYVCEGFSRSHTILPIRQTCIESWKKHNSCTRQTVTSEISYSIGTNSKNIFPYEFRPLLNINNLSEGPQLHNGYPISHVVISPSTPSSSLAGYTIQPVRMYTKSFKDLDLLAPAPVNTAVPATDINFYNYPTSSPTHDAYYLDINASTNPPAYSAPFESSAITYTGTSSNTSFGTSTVSNTDLLLTSDESFTQGFVFDLKTICASDFTTNILGGDVFVLGIDNNDMCSVSDAVIDNDITIEGNPSTTTTVYSFDHSGSSYTVASALPSSISINNLMWPINIQVAQAGALENPIIYFENNQLSGITINGLVITSGGADPDCSNAIAPIVSGDYTLFHLPQTLSGPINTFFLCITVPSCTSISIKDSLSWSCDGYPDPNDHTQYNTCQKFSLPLAHAFEYNDPGVNLGLSVTTTATTPLNTCTDIPVDIQLLVNQSGNIGIGDLSGEIWLPSAFTINSPQLIINGITYNPITVSSSTSPNGVGNIWTFNFNNFTDFNNSNSVVGGDGITYNDDLHIKFNIYALCNASDYNSSSFTFKLPYRTYCQSNTLLSTPFQFEFTPCSQASPEITVTPAPFSCTSSSNKATLTVHPLGQPTGTFVSGTTFEWSTSETTASIDVSQAGTYSVTVTEPGSSACPTQASVMVPLTSLGGIVVGDAPGVGIPTLQAALAANVLLPNTGGVSAANTPQNIIIKGNFTINADYTFFNNSEIICDEGARIYINANYTLTVGEGVHIHGCDFMWRGIVVNSRANILLNGTAQNRILIEDADKAITLSSNTTYRLQYTHFNKNFIGLYIVLSTSNVTQPANIGGIIGNHFTCSSNLLPVYSGYIQTTGLPIPSTVSFAGIYANNLSVFDLSRDPTVSPLPANNDYYNRFNNLCNGVIAYNTTMLLHNCVFTNILSYAYPISEKYPTSTAIFSAAKPILSVIPHPTNLIAQGVPHDQSDEFTIDVCGIGVLARQITHITQIADFNIRNALYEGIRVENNLPNGIIRVERNRIVSGYRGIHTLNNTPTKIYDINENFIIAQGIALSNWGISVGEGIEVHESGVYMYTPAKEWKNVILMAGGIQYGIHNNAVNRILTWENSIFIFSRFSTAGIYQSGNPRIYSQSNIVNGWGINATNHSGAYNPVGIYYNASGSELGIYKCDDVDNTYTGILFNGTCNNSQYMNLKIRNHTIGLHYLDGVGILPQGVGAIKNGNQWIDVDYYAINPTFFGGLNDNPASSINGQRIEAHINSAPFRPINNSPSNFITNAASSGFINDCDYLPPNQYPLVSPTGGNAADNYLKAVIKDSVEYDIYPEELKWQNQWAMYRHYKEYADSIDFDSFDSLFLSDMGSENIGTFYQIDNTLSTVLNDTTLLDSIGSLSNMKNSIIGFFPIIDSLLEVEGATKGSSYWNLLNAKTAFYDSLNVIDSLINIQDAMVDSVKQITIDSLKDANSGIIAVNLVEENMQLFNDIYLSTLASGVDTFTDQQIEDIAYLAFQCPLRGGEVVFKARSLYALIVDTVYNDEELCDTTNNLLRRSRVMKDKQKAKNAEQEVVYQLYPNPAKNSLIVSSNTPFCSTCRLQVYDLTGKMMLTTELPEGGYNTRLNIANLQTGLYVVNINNGQGNLYNTKLSIIK